jgi:hypothetical protein
MKTKTHVKAGGLNLNHNERLVRDVEGENACEGGRFERQ